MEKNTGYDQIIAIPFKDRWVEFTTRSQAGYDYTVTDKIVIKEMFLLNVYRVSESDFADTGVVFDVGANIGAFSIFAVLMGAKKVYAFEPDSQNFELLLQNIKLNGMEKEIIPIKLGIFRDSGKQKLFNGQGASFIKGEKFLKKKYKAALKQGKKAIEEIDTISLEQAFADNKIANIDVLKVDVEGSEYSIFDVSTPEIIGKSRYITMEFHTNTVQAFGGLVAKLTQTHKIETLGAYNRGGQIYARHY